MTLESNVIYNSSIDSYEQFFCTQHLSAKRSVVFQAVSEVCQFNP